MTTVYDGTAVVNPEPRYLGTGVLDLYDWLRLRSRPGRTRRVEELTPPGAPRYEQLADRLRKRIFGGTWPDDASGPTLGTAYGVSQPVVQRAFEALEREGLVLLESGRRTSVLPRSRWRITIEAPLPDGAADPAAILGQVTEALGRAGQPAIGDIAADLQGLVLRIGMTVESADLPGAVAAALPVARLALGALPIMRQGARPA